MKQTIQKILGNPLLLIVVLLGIATVLLFVMIEVTKQPELRDGNKVVVRIDRSRIDATVAASVAAREKGLAGSEPLSENRGLLFTSSRSEIPTIFMRGVNYPIDIVWITAGTVSEVTPDVPPQPGVAEDQLTRYRPSGPADQVLETQAGWAAQHNVQPGDPVKISSL